MIGARLREERERLGYTQEDFSQLAEASKRSQIEWEKGGAFPNAATLKKFAAAGADIQYIVTGKRLLTTTLMRHAVKSAFKMVQSSEITVTPEQFAQMSIALLPALMENMAVKKETADTKQKNMAKNSNCNAQVAQGSDMVPIGGKARFSRTKK